MEMVSIQSVLTQVHFLEPEFGSILSGILTIFLLVLSGFASGSEIAFFSLSPTDLSEMDTEKIAADRHIQMLREDIGNHSHHQ